MIRQTKPRVHVLRIEEVFRPGNPGYWVHPDWAVRFPWLVQGTTGRGRDEGGAVFDFALFTDPPAPEARESWEVLGKSLGLPKVIHSHQIHGREILVHEEQAPADGRETRLELAPDADGHVTRAAGILLGVTVADCVPVSLVDPNRRAVGLFHAGWRGAAAGILERGIELFKEEFMSGPEDLYLHLGPAICGDCYEVGVEVHVAMGLPEPDNPGPVDLRGYLSARAVAAGVEAAKISESVWCTLCGESPFFSHRRGELGRQVGFLGVLPARPPRG